MSPYRRNAIVDIKIQRRSPTNMVAVGMALTIWLLSVLLTWAAGYILFGS